MGDDELKKSFEVNGHTIESDKTYDSVDFSGSKNFCNSELSDVTFLACDLSGVDFSSCFFQNVNFGGCNMTGSNFSYSFLADCEFYKCKLEVANFSESTLRASFEVCNLDGVSFEGAELDYEIINFEGSSLNKSNFGRTKILEGEFDREEVFILPPIEHLFADLDLKEVSFFGSEIDFSQFDFSYSRMDGADLRVGELWQCTFIGASLKGAIFPDCNYSNFEDANLEGANFSYADMGGVNLRNADLTNADLSFSHIYRSDGALADLTGANLTNANLSACTFYGHLEGTVLTGAILAGAEFHNFSGAPKKWPNGWVQFPDRSVDKDGDMNWSFAIGPGCKLFNFYPEGLDLSLVNFIDANIMNIYGGPPEKMPRGWALKPLVEEVKKKTKGKSTEKFELVKVRTEWL